MKIQKFSSNINFGRKRLFKAILKQPEIFNREKNVDVFISELEISDMPKMQKLENYWEKTDYGYPIIRNFVHQCEKPYPQVGKDIRYYIVENPKVKTEERIKALAVAQIIDNNVYLSMLQSERQIKKQKSIRGAGSCILYATSKLAHSHKKDSISLISTSKAYDFYKKLGFCQVISKTRNLYMDKTNFKNFEAELENRYSIEPIV